MADIWSSGTEICRDGEKKILPVYNRCVIFSTTDFAYHGHPEPLSCPDGMTRKSLALYYYTVSRPENEKSAPHTTLFRARPGERAVAGPLIRSIAKKILPPIVLDAASFARKKVLSAGKKFNKKLKKIEKP